MLDRAYSTTEPVIEVDFDASSLDLYYWGSGKLEVVTEHKFTGDTVTITMKSPQEIYYPEEKMGLIEAYEKGIWDDFDFGGRREPNF